MTLNIVGFNVEAAAYLMKIAPDNCIYLNQSASIHLPFHLLDRLTPLKARMNLSKEFDNMIAFVYNSRALLSIADTDFYEVHSDVKIAYEIAVRNMKSKVPSSQTNNEHTFKSISTLDNSYSNSLQFIIVEGTEYVLLDFY